MLMLGIIFIVICILLVLLITKLFRWMKTPTYWHQTDAGWYGTGHDKMTEKDKEHIRKQIEKNNRKK